MVVKNCFELDNTSDQYKQSETSTEMYAYLFRYVIERPNEYRIGGDKVIKFIIEL